MRNWTRTLPTRATRLAKPTAQLCLGPHPPPMLGDPRLGVRFGFEHADPGRMTVRDADLDAEVPVVKRHDAISGFGVGVDFRHFDPARPSKTENQARK